MTKNLNRKILTKNLVTFKKWDGVKGSACYLFSTLSKREHL